MKDGVVFFLSAVLLTVLAGCGHHDEHHEHDEAAEHHAHDEIVFEPEKAKAAGVVVEEIMPSTFHGVIHTSGKVTAASCDETTVVATISGRVSYKSHVSEGLKVANGTALFTITSAGMQVADGDPVQRARIDFEKAERDYHRAQQLINDRIISQKDLEVAKAEYEATKLTYNSVQHTRSAGGVIVTAPRGGYVKQCLVSEGDYVEAGQPLLILTQNQHLYLRAEVPERRFNELNNIKSAKFRTSYSDKLYDITDMGGHIQSYGRSAELNNSYIPVIFEFNNTGDVVQGSYAEIYLITSEREHVMSVPMTALTEEQGLHYVYIQVDEEGYRKQEVTLGERDGDRVEICSGIESGDKVVVKGAIQVKLASASNVIPAHTHNH
ncbi:MAG: efflux RND transporter periplasmic adaptor subunit [Bacteroidales bacterium]|nr:efflux RND transporter periplasmic adaptor subunit [Candidatus Physcousia equi]